MAKAMMSDLADRAQALGLDKTERIVIFTAQTRETSLILYTAQIDEIITECIEATEKAKAELAAFKARHCAKCRYCTPVGICTNETALLSVRVDYPMQSMFGCIEWEPRG